jgi:hypothetical protein
LTSKREPSAGDDIDSRCLKCKNITNHTIVAMVGARVAKVQCNVCRGVHNYRPVTVEKKTAAPRRQGESAGQPAGSGVRPPAKTGRTAKELKAEALFLERLGDRGARRATPYAMNAVFQENDLINHAVFGLGIVARKIAPNKIEVIFRDGSRILMCAPAAKS